MKLERFKDRRDNFFFTWPRKWGTFGRGSGKGCPKEIVQSGFASLQVRFFTKPRRVHHSMIMNHGRAHLEVGEFAGTHVEQLELPR